MSKTRVVNLLAHWNTISPVQISPLKFYEAVEEAITARSLPGVVTSRVFWKQGAPLSARRQYLRVRRQRLAFDICGIPLGNSFQASWWLSEIAPGPMGLFFEMPLLGPFLERMISPVTFYQVDATDHFQHSVHEAVLQVIDAMNRTQGTRLLSDQQHQPIMSEFYE